MLLSAAPAYASDYGDFGLWVMRYVWLAMVVYAEILALLCWLLLGRGVEGSLGMGVIAGLVGSFAAGIGAALGSFFGGLLLPLLVVPAVFFVLLWSLSPDTSAPCRYVIYLLATAGSVGWTYFSITVLFTIPVDRGESRPMEPETIQKLAVTGAGMALVFCLMFFWMRAQAMAAATAPAPELEAEPTSGLSLDP